MRSSFFNYHRRFHALKVSFFSCRTGCSIQLPLRDLIPRRPCGYRDRSPNTFRCRQCLEEKIKNQLLIWNTKINWLIYHINANLSLVRRWLRIERASFRSAKPLLKWIRHKTFLLFCIKDKINKTDKTKVFYVNIPIPKLQSGNCLYKVRCGGH